MKKLLPVFLIVFIDLLGFGIMIPILPYYAQEFGASGKLIGLLMASYSLMQFFFAPLWGKVSDHIGRKPILMVSILGASISMLLIAQAPSLTWVFIGRILAGIFGANISTAHAYVADVTDAKNRAKGMGLIGASFGLGFIFGPAIGGILASFDYTYPFYFASGLAFLNFLLGVVIIEEPKMSAKKRAQHRTKRFDFQLWKKTLSRPDTGLAIGLFFLLICAIVQMEVVFAIFMKERFGYDAKEAGIVLAATGLVMVLVQGGLIGRLVKKYGEIKLIFFGNLICAISLVFFGGSTLLVFSVAAMCILAAGHGALSPSLSSLASKVAPLNQKGLILGIYHSSGSLARVVSPPIAGWLYDEISIASPFYFGAVLLLVATVIAFARLRTGPSEC